MKQELKITDEIKALNEQMGEYVDAIKKAYDYVSPMWKMSDTMNDNQTKMCIKHVFNVLFAQKATFEKIQKHNQRTEKYIISVDEYMALMTRSLPSNPSTIVTKKGVALQIPEGFITMYDFSNKYSYVKYNQLNLIRKCVNELNEYQAKIGPNYYIHEQKFHDYLISDQCRKKFPKTHRDRQEWNGSNSKKAGAGGH